MHVLEVMQLCNCTPGRHKFDLNDKEKTHENAWQDLCALQTYREKFRGGGGYRVKTRQGLTCSQRWVWGEEAASWSPPRSERLATGVHPRWHAVPLWSWSESDPPYGHSAPASPCPQTWAPGCSPLVSPSGALRVGRIHHQNRYQLEQSNYAHWMNMPLTSHQKPSWKTLYTTPLYHVSSMTFELWPCNIVSLKIFTLNF